MTEPLKIPYTIDTLDAVPAPIQLFFAKGEDGKFHLQLAGPHPDSAKVSAFRDSNRSLNAQLTALTTERDKHAADLAALAEKYKDVNVDEYTALKAQPDTSAKLTEVERLLATEKAAHAATQLRHVVGQEFARLGGRRDAEEFIASKAAEIFTMENGKVSTQAFSTANPGVPLTVAEWMTSQLAAAEFAFQPHKGVGPLPTTGAPVKRTISAADPKAFGENLAAIADGTVRVV